MASSHDAVFRCPVADGLHETLAIKRGVQAEKEVPCVCCLVAYIVPKGRIERFGREAVTRLELFVEIVRPHTSLRPVHRGLIEEGGDDGLSEIVGKVLVVSLVRVMDKQADGFGGQIVDIRVAVLDALAHHHVPTGLLWSCPRHLASRFVIAVTKRNNLLGVGVPSHNRHELSLKRYLAVEGSATAYTVLRFVEALNGVVRVIVHEGSHARTVDGPHASAWEAILIVD